MKGKTKEDETKRQKQFREELEFQGVKFAIFLPRTLRTKLTLLSIFECVASFVGAMLIILLPKVIIMAFGGEGIIEGMTTEVQPVAISISVVLVFLFGTGMQDLAGYLAQKRGCRIDFGPAQVRIVGLMSMSAVLFATWIAILRAISLNDIHQVLSLCVAYFVGYGCRRLIMIIRRQSCKTVAKFVAEDYTMTIAKGTFPQLKQIFACKDYMDD